VAKTNILYNREERYFPEYADPGRNTRTELIYFAVFFFKRTKSKV